MEEIYIRKKLKHVIIDLFKILVMCILVIVILWTCIFGTDYLLYKNNREAIFIVTRVENVEDDYITIQRGLGYTFKTQNGIKTLYVFGNKIK